MLSKVNLLMSWTRFRRALTAESLSAIAQLSRSFLN